MMSGMTKALTYEMTYDAPIDTVQQMLFDPAFREAVCDAQHAVSRQVISTPPAVRVEYTQKVQGLPSFAAKFVGETIQVIQNENWAGHDAQVTVEIPGKPGSISGTFKLVESGGRTIQRVALDVTVRMPLVGGKLESLIADLFLTALKREERTGREWLAKQ